MENKVDGLLAELEQVKVIDALSKLNSTDIIVIMPEANIKTLKNKKIIISVMGISADPIQGVNGDNGKIGLACNISVGIKSLGKEPLKDMIETHRKINDTLKNMGYKEGVSNTAQDEGGIPVSFIQYKVRRYK